MKRRDLVQLFGGTAVGWPSIVFAQQTSRMRRVAVLTQFVATDPYGAQVLAALMSALAKLGWVRGHNLQLDVRWTGGNRSRARAYAKELVALRPDVIVASPSSVVAAVLHETKTIPVVFVGVTDPVGLGFITSLAHPGGNATGFGNPQLSLAGKWLQTLKEIAPSVTRLLAIISPDTGSGARSTLPALRTAAQSLRLALTIRFPSSEQALLDAIGDFAREPGGGLVQPPDALMYPFRSQEIAAAARYRLPAMYGLPDYVASGGLIFYGPSGGDVLGDMPLIATYVDRILRGAKPADLPVEGPNTFELVINLKTANALELHVPESLLLRADRVIK
jgi:putative tryptophan/tyrosine transport system substrate-binding protein